MNTIDAFNVEVLKKANKDNAKLRENELELKAQIEVLRAALDDCYTEAKKNAGSFAAKIAKISDKALLKTGYESLTDLNVKAVKIFIEAVAETGKLSRGDQDFLSNFHSEIKSGWL